MNRDQIQTASKAQVGALFDMAQHTVGELENWLNLNLSVYKEIMGEFADCCDTAFDIQDFSAAMQWQAGVYRPFLERAVQYNTRLMGLASGSARELSKVFENRFHHLQPQLSLNAWTPGAWPWPRSGDVSMAALQEGMQALMSLWTAMSTPSAAGSRARAARPDLHALDHGRPASNGHKAHSRPH
jgi:phasin family protein